MTWMTDNLQTHVHVVLISVGFLSVSLTASWNGAYIWETAVSHLHPEEMGQQKVEEAEKWGLKENIDSGINRNLQLNEKKPIHLWKKQRIEKCL